MALDTTALLVPIISHWYGDSGKNGERVDYVERVEEIIYIYIYIYNQCFGQNA